MSETPSLLPRAALALAALTAPVSTSLAADVEALRAKAGADPLLLKMAPALARTEVALAHRRETLSNNPNDWRDTQLELLHQFAPRKLVIGRVTDSERYGLSDTTLGLSAYYPLGERTTAYAEVTTSNTHRVLPRDSLHLQLAQTLQQGWGVIAGLRQVTYDSTVVDVADLTLERYFSDYRVALTAYPSHSRTAGSASSYRLQLSRYYGDENNIQLMFANGTEVDKPTGVDQVLATSVRSVALFGRHWLTRAWGLDYAVSHTEQGESTRRSASLGLRYRY